MLFYVDYFDKKIECPVCGEFEQWERRIKDSRWIEVVNDFIKEHRRCDGELILNSVLQKSEP